MGNCGEMADIAFCLCREMGLKASIVIYKDKINENFEHKCCSVSISGREYIIDSWENLFCDRNEHVAQLIEKKHEWEIKEKFIVNIFMHVVVEKKDLSSITVSDEDIKNITVTHEGLFALLTDVA